MAHVMTRLAAAIVLCVTLLGTVFAPSAAARGDGEREEQQVGHDAPRQ